MQTTIRVSLKRLRDKVVTPPVTTVMSWLVQGFSTLSMQKDPNPLLSPDTLHYDCTPAELSKRGEMFMTYLNNGHDKALSYLNHFMDGDHKKSMVPGRLSAGLTVEQNLRVLKDDQKVSYP